MVVKELKIHGFKSFAEPIKIPFSHAFTAIIGPNGCGKSNILDAFKWVLGEKSVKSMRGEKMEDVIFSGTHKRKPANFAQVTLVLDNTNRLFDIDFEEIQISRRLYRDGQSHYFINGTRVARKEIETLLMDTGLGKSSYSFMEQGNMDLILSSKPEDRRYIFEEAAGISRFKAQKEEALKNLENTQFNIERIQDIMRELERELKLKQTQAEKTQAYNALLKEKKEYDLRIRFLSIREIQKKQEALQNNLSKKIAEREKRRQKIIQTEEQIKELSKQKETFIQELHAIDTANQVSRERISLLKRKLEEIQQKQEVERHHLDELNKHIKKNETRLKHLKLEEARQKQLTLEIKDKVSQTQKEIHEINQKIENTQTKNKNQQKQLEKNQQKIQKTNETLKTLREKQTRAIEELLVALKKQKKELQAEEKKTPRKNPRTLTKNPGL